MIRGLFSFFAFCNASGPHSYQSTGLSACSFRYGLLELTRRLPDSFPALFSRPGPQFVNTTNRIKKAKIIPGFIAIGNFTLSQNHLAIASPVPREEEGVEN